MEKNNYAIIMAGGIGSRFWPMSRISHPKQFMDVLGTGKTLIQQTFDRLNKVCPSENIFVVTNMIYKDIVLEQLNIDDDQVLCEPVMRNTAPAIAYPAFKIQQKNPEANLIVAPSDHLILDEPEFVKIINSAIEASKENEWLMTLGITPSRPDTGYGYIQYDKESSFNQFEKLRKVKKFTEKPDLATAKEFLESGDYLWNSGIFIWSLKSIIKAFEMYLPEIYNLFSSEKDKYFTEGEEGFINRIYPVCQKISIDYGVMESAKNVYVIESDFGWSDLGTWGSLFEMKEKDDNKNVLIGSKILAKDSKENMVRVPNDKLVVLQGVEDFIIVENDNILLICKKKEEQKIKDIVNEVKNKFEEDI